jgi:hypothetical protein
VSALFTEDLLEKILLAKTTHKKLWKFYQKFFCKEGAHCTSCYVVVGFFLVLQNRTIGFEIKSL